MSDVEMIAGSVTRIVTREEFALENESRAAAKIIACADDISERLSSPAVDVTENVAA